MNSNLLISWVRTVVAPMLVGFLGQFLAFLAANDVSADSRLAVAATVAMGWYLIARLAQVYNPKLGFLLLVAARPDYSETEDDPQTTAEQVLLSVRRTAVPLIVGTAGTFLIKHGFAVDSAQVVLLLEGVLTSGYYTALRWIEERSSRATDAPAQVAGVLLGGRAEVKY